MSESELPQRLYVEEEFDEPLTLPMRPEAQVQMSLLQLRVQDQDRHTKAHQD